MHISVSLWRIMELESMPEIKSIVSQRGVMAVSGGWIVPAVDKIQLPYKAGCCHIITPSQTFLDLLHLSVKDSGFVGFFFNGQGGCKPWTVEFTVHEPAHRDFVHFLHEDSD